MYVYICAYVRTCMFTGVCVFYACTWQDTDGKDLALAV